MKRTRDAYTWLPCLVCGVDSGPVLTFFFWIVGCGVLGFLTIGVWAWSRGKFRSGPVGRRPLEIEESNGNG